MPDQKPDKEFTLGEKVSLIVFGVCFFLYLLNVLIGKATIVLGWKVFHFGNIGEFILLFLASIAFVIAAIHRESVFNNNNGKSPN